MLRLDEIQQSLLHLVGWEQDFSPENKIASDLTATESGLYFQGAHPLVTLQNIRSIMPLEYTFQYPEFKVGETGQYCTEGSIWQYGGKLYRCLVAGMYYTSPATSAEWEEVTGEMELSAYVRQLTLRGISEVVANFIQSKQLARETRSLVERRTLFDGAARMRSTITAHDKLVGFEIVPVRAMGVTTRIERVGLQMIGATGAITLYLFHSSQVAPIRTLTFNYTNTSGGFQWFTPSEPLYLPYIGANTDSGGAWYLCYLQGELPLGMQALNVSKDWSAEPCQTCLGGSIESWRQLTKYLQVSPFSAEAFDPASPEIPDTGELSYTNTLNYGLNLEVTVGCDLTDFIKEQRGIFARALQLQVAANVLRTLAMNPDVRVNRNQVNVTRDSILYEIDGNPQGRASGLGYELKEVYKALAFDTKGLDRVCLQCQNNGVKYRTV